MNESPSALFHTFGCKLNFAETATVERIFGEHGIEKASPDCTPDFIVINSCSVTAEADRKCRSAIRNFNRRFPQAAIIVTGCYAQLKPAEVALLPGVAVVAGVNDKLALAEMALDWLHKRQQTVDVAPARDLRSFMPSCSRGDRTRFFLKVQDGCDYWCSYCTIPRARGRSRSGTISNIVAQAEEAAELGGREIVLTGVNIGDFGAGRNENLLDLCRELDRVESIERFRISSIEPNLLTEELIDFVASSRAFMPHFHIPLQSGSDKVLALMRRRYDTSLFAGRVEKIRRTIPDAFIGADLIVGARGETPEEFERSRAFISDLDISHLHVFPYSERPGTKALEIEGVVDQAEKHRRAHVMGQLSAEKHAAFASRFTGTVRPALLERPQTGKASGGFTDNYLRISIEASQEFDNRIIPVRLVSLMDDGETFLASPA